jgi:hypothetical protein
MHAGMADSIPQSEGREIRVPAGALKALTLSTCRSIFREPDFVELELALGREWHVDVQDSQGLSLSLEQRVRRKLILAGILPKLSDLDQGAIGKAIEAAGAEQFKAYPALVDYPIFTITCPTFGWKL